MDFCVILYCVLSFLTLPHSHLSFSFASELSNTIWAFGTAGLRGDTQVELVKFMADALDDGDGQFFGFQFKRMFN